MRADGEVLMRFENRPPSRRTTAWTRKAPLAAIALMTFGCTSAWHAADADREVTALLRDYDRRILSDREQWTQHPAEVVAPHSDDADGPLDASVDESADETTETALLDLAASLELAFSSGRDFLDRKEGLYLQGLDLTLTRYNFGPVLNSTISYLWRNTEDGVADDSLGATLGMTDTLATGAQLSIASRMDGTRTDDPALFSADGSFRYDTSITVQLEQPLLRGAGYEVSHEALTQRERDVIDAVRSFELFRQNYSIRVAAAYYDLVSRQARLGNDEQNYLDAVFDRKKAEALRQVDRNQDDDVFLARRREIEAEDALLVARTDYRRALDDFKILLGQPTATEIRIATTEPVFAPVRVEPASAVEAAHHNRLDLHADRDRVTDAKRQVRIARDGLRPDLDMNVEATFADTDALIADVSPDRWSTSVGFTLGVPVDRKGERNAYRSALIRVDQARRDLQQRFDEVERDVRNQLRELAQVEKRIQLQKDQIERERRAVAVTQIRYESGDADNRDLLDARQGLTNAQNALIDLKVRHFIARLSLRRDLGILLIDDKGMWRS